MKRKRLSDGKPWQKHEFFASPPWATRTLFEDVMPVATGEKIDRKSVISEPAAGLGHMSEIIAEYADSVFASDIYRYRTARPGEAVNVKTADFLSAEWHGPPSDWIVTNPPFGLSQRFLDRAMDVSLRGVAFLQRMQWLEGQRRYQNIYALHPPSLIAPFAERVPMCEGGWDPDGTTATMYAWFIWVRAGSGRWPPALLAAATLPMFLIPPGRKQEWSKPSDCRLAERFVPGFVPPSPRTGKGRRRRPPIALLAAE